MTDESTEGERERIRSKQGDGARLVYDEEGRGLWGHAQIGKEIWFVWKSVVFSRSQ